MKGCAETCGSPFMLKILAAVSLVSTAFATAAIAQTTYDCTITVPATQNWVPEQLVIAHDAATGKVTVNDPLIHHYVGHPVEGRVAVDNAARITFAWGLKHLTNKSQQFATEMAYRATYIKATGQMSISARPLGYSNTFDARGSCKRQ
jgi:hypothetical protein